MYIMYTEFLEIIKLLSDITWWLQYCRVLPRDDIFDKIGSETLFSHNDADPYNFSQGRTSKEVEGVSEKGLDVRFKEIE